MPKERVKYILGPRDQHSGTVSGWVSPAAELRAFHDASVPDLVGPGLRLLFVGINPGLWTAATQTHFAHPGNRFYPALRLAGIIDRDISRSEGMTDDDRAYLSRVVSATPTWSTAPRPGPTS